MRTFIILIFFLFSSLVHAAFSDVDRQELATKNILTNGGFESSKDGWTASGGTFAVVTSGSNLLIGRVSATWDSSGSSQTFTSRAITIPKGLYGKNGAVFCSIQTPSGTATHTISAYDGTNSLATTNVYSNTTPVNTGALFVFPSSGTMAIRITSVASNEPLIAIDDCFIGSADGTYLSLVKSNDILSARVDSAGTPSIVSQSPVNWISSLTDNGTGDTTVNFTSGVFTTAPHCVASGYIATPFRFCSAYTSTAISATAVRIRCANDGGVAVDDNFFLSCQKVGADNQPHALKVDQVANSWSGYHDNTCSFPRTNTAYGDPTTDASCALIERTNANFGTVTGSNNLPSITFTPSRAGRYFICANVSAVGATSGADLALRLWDGTTTIAERDWDAAAATTASTVSLCGLYVSNSTSAKTISVQSKSSTGAITIQVLTGASAVEWSIFQSDQSFPAPAVANSVTNPSNGVTNTCSGYIDNTGTPTVVRSDNNCVSSVTDNGVGDVTLNFAAGTFSSASYNCGMTAAPNANVGSSVQTYDFGTARTSTALRVRTGDSSWALADRDFEFICMGPK